MISSREIRDGLNISVSTRIQLAKGHVDWSKEKWRNILWTDESKTVFFFFFGSNNCRQFVRTAPNTKFKPQYTLKTVKNGGASIMIWGCFSALCCLMLKRKCL
uniref:Transposase Tc1-like domain-containing protein n=1 Tax=Cynoglossus semilaevis TaxID=244447 RepID=A0A3P8WKX6_CYNSE